MEFMEFMHRFLYCSLVANAVNGNCKIKVRTTKNNKDNLFFICLWQWCNDLNVRLWEISGSSIDTALIPVFINTIQ